MRIWISSASDLQIGSSSELSGFADNRASVDMPLLGPHGAQRRVAKLAASDGPSRLQRVARFD